MDRTINPFVSVEWLREHGNDANVVIMDCRFRLGAADYGKTAYQSGHIPGAHYAPLEYRLAAPLGQHGGRHPLPDKDQMRAFLQAAGVGNQTHVIAYDDGGEMASRLWWLLRYYSHDAVSLLTGGFAAWQTAQLPLSQETPAPCTEKIDLQLVERPDMTVSRQEVMELLQGREEDGIVLVDSRARARYCGDLEPLDPVAGHIPGAICLPWDDSLLAPATWQGQDALAKRFADLLERRVVVYCGSGVTACANVLAMHSVGMNPQLYAGSWSDWCSYADSPVATGG